MAREQRQGIMAKYLLAILDRSTYQADGIMHEKSDQAERKQDKNLLIVVIRKENSPKELEDVGIQHHSQQSSGDVNLNPREGQITIGWMRHMKMSCQNLETLWGFNLLFACLINKRFDGRTWKATYMKSWIFHGNENVKFPWWYTVL